MKLLVVNAGSSSLKIRLLEHEQLLLDLDIEAQGADFEAQRLEQALDQAGPVQGIGHRVVHGGWRFNGPQLITSDLEAYLASLKGLAPLHQQTALAAIAVCRRARPQTPQVACFDTAFHATIPPAASTYAIPRDWRVAHGLRRFGFHGLSHSYAARRAKALLGRDRLRIVTCHLGAGASLAAVKEGRSVDTTMGLTPLEGLVMATRSGSVDPGLLIWLQQGLGLSADEVNDALEHRSGLVGLAGTPDMRSVVARAGSGDADAALALDVYLHRLRQGIASMAAAMEGLDAIVFTGGVGENAAEVRQAASDGLAFLGVAVDPAANRSAEPDADLSAGGARVATLLVRSREDLEIAREVEGILRDR